MAVVVVESPAKAKTINKYLGPGYTVLASYGHVRDLPAKDGSVDPDHEFAMTWEVASDSATPFGRKTWTIAEAEMPAACSFSIRSISSGVRSSKRFPSISGTEARIMSSRY